MGVDVEKVVWFTKKEKDVSCIHTKRVKTYVQDGIEKTELQWGLQHVEKTVGMKNVVWFTKKEKACLAFHTKVKIGKYLLSIQDWWKILMWFNSFKP